MGEQNTANWLQNIIAWWLPTVISLAGAGASWAAFAFSVRRRRSTDRLAGDREYDQLAISRENFWRILREAYQRFRVSSTLPEDLEALIETSNMPPNIPRPRGKELRTWAVENEHKLNPDQRALWQFCSEIYPPRGTNMEKENTLLLANADVFHKARGYLSRFWKSWIPILGLSYVKEHFKSARLQVIMLCWLECALILQTREEGGGKEPLFEFAKRICQRR